MLEFSKSMQRLISMNKLEQAIDEFQNVLDRFNPITETDKIEQRDLRTAIIATSQRLYLVKEKEQKGNLSDDEIMRERRSVSNSFLDIINDLDKYESVRAFLIVWEDEQAWKKTNSLNAIDAYKEYLNKYPNGKYADDARKFISMLKTMEEQKLKEKAEEIYTPPVQSHTPKQEPDMHTTPPVKNRNLYEQQDASTSSGEELSNGLYIVLLIGCIIPIIGIGSGAYFLYTKKDGVYKYDEASRKKGRTLMIVGGIMVFIYIIGGY